MWLLGERNISLCVHVCENVAFFFSSLYFPPISLLISLPSRTYRQGHTAFIERILSVDGIDVDAKDAAGRTALLIAACNGHASALSVLLKKNARVDVTDPLAKTPLHYAAHNDRLESVKLIVESVADEQQRTKILTAGDVSGFTPMHCACNTGAVDVGMYLAQFPCTLNTLAADGEFCVFVCFCVFFVCVCVCVCVFCVRVCVCVCLVVVVFFCCVFFFVY